MQVGFGKVGVNLGGGDVGMSEHFLNVTHGGSAFEHFGGTGMTEAGRGAKGERSEVWTAMPERQSIKRSPGGGTTIPQGVSGTRAKADCDGRSTHL